MDGENKGKPYERMDDLGVNTPIFGSTPNSGWGIVIVYRSLGVVINLVRHRQYFWAPFASSSMFLLVSSISTLG